MSSALLDPEFARELEALRRRLQIRARSGSAGDRRGKRRGSSAEFLEHRPYTPGDDLRRIDWLAFARTGEPVFKLFSAEEDVVVRLLVDASASLDLGSPSKLLVAKKIAASIAYVAMCDSERAQIVSTSGGEINARAPTRGRAALPKVIRELDAIRPGGTTDLASAIDAVVLRADRPGMLVAISDFLDPGSFDAALTRAASAGHQLAIFQVLAPEELMPTFDGDFALEDAETGALLEVTVDARAIDAYLAQLNALIVRLRALAKRHRGTYVRVATTDAMLPAIRRFVARGID